tara:strand:- start:2224 stop:2337 length:114 start_codon:yes stop_codon:yes gene_type:complete
MDNFTTKDYPEENTSWFKLAIYFLIFIVGIIYLLSLG